MTFVAHLCSDCNYCVQLLWFAAAAPPVFIKMRNQCMNEGGGGDLQSQHPSQGY